MKPIRAVLMLAGTGLSLSIGWGIRGNFGHEAGAMIPGVLATLAAVILAGREDWWTRSIYFAFFGALGWAVGGSISYMQVIAYTHSGHSSSVLYGFACLFIIGFLWAAIGGAGSALPLEFDLAELGEFFPPLIAIFVIWLLQYAAEITWSESNPDFRQRSALYWYDTDWLHVLTAMAAVVLLAGVRRRWTRASSLLLHLGFGWWATFLVLVVLLGWRMTPPRGDNWAGCVGLVLALWYWCWRHGFRLINLCSLVTGFGGGIGFVLADLIKLIGIKTGWQTNWHSLLEQSYGLFNGLGLGLAFWRVARRGETRTDASRAPTWTKLFAVGFVLIGVTYLNLEQNIENWTRAKTVPESLYGIPFEIWFDLGYGLLAVAVLGLLLAIRRGSLAALPEHPLGRAQLLYLVFLWWIVVGNFERALVGFAPVRLITEGVIHLNAVLCTLLVLAPSSANSPHPASGQPKNPARRACVFGLAASAAIILMAWAAIRGIYGDQPIGFAGRHIRFGPDATATTAKPAANQPHP